MVDSPLKASAQVSAFALFAEESMPRKLSPKELIRLIGTDQCPHLVDVRRRPVYEAAPRRIAGAVWRDHMKTDGWLPQFCDGRLIVVYCIHGHNVSEIAAAKLAAAGVDVAMLEGGIEAFEAAGGPAVATQVSGFSLTQAPSVWVTRERPKIDRVACPWLIRRFIDPYSVFHFVTEAWVKDVAEELDATPFDVDGVHFSHRGEACSFDTLLKEFAINDPALRHVARIVRGADTARLDLEPEAAGLLAISLGLSAVEADDVRQTEKAMTVYDALYGWCRDATAERHNWPATAVPK
jgi:rhodanese-related sulfurtransferase